MCICRSIDLRLKVMWGQFVVFKQFLAKCTLKKGKEKKLTTLWLTVLQYLVSPNFFVSTLCFAFCVSQLQLLHSSVRVWEGAPDCSCVRIAQDVTAEPASADRCRSLWQREPGWVFAATEPQQQQQQLHQQQARDTVRLAMLTNTLLPESFSNSLHLLDSVWARV